jgi:hypothetical protein
MSRRKMLSRLFSSSVILATGRWSAPAGALWPAQMTSSYLLVTATFFLKKKYHTQHMLHPRSSGRLIRVEAARAHLGRDGGCSSRHRRGGARLVQLIAARPRTSRAPPAQFIVAGTELTRTHLVTVGMELTHAPTQCGDLL